MSTKTSHLDVRKLAFMGMLTALMIVMAFTPLGYFKTAGIEISFLMIPVALGAVLFGPGAGAFFGGVFGLTSFIQCFGMSAFGVTLMGINPIFTFITCMVPRVLTGWLSGLLFKALHGRDKTRLLSYAGACLSGSLLNTAFFTGCVLLFFWNTEFIQNLSQTLGAGTNIMLFVGAFVGLNGIIEALVCFILGTVLSKTLSVLLKMTARK